MKLLKAVIIFLMLLICIAAVAVDAAGVKVTGVFSDMHLNKKTGDVLGMEIIIIYSTKGYMVIFQSSEGLPSVPITVSASVHGNNIEFALPESGGYSGVFKGKIGRAELIGQFENGQVNYKGERIIRLKRGQSYWQ